jgi:hypothetical protein
MFSFEIRHRIKHETLAGRLARKAVCWVGLRSLRAGRRLLAWSFYRCSWCGANCGMSCSVSRRGVRCDGFLGRECSDVDSL